MRLQILSKKGNLTWNDPERKYHLLTVAYTEAKENQLKEIIDKEKSIKELNSQVI